MRICMDGVLTRVRQNHAGWNPSDCRCKFCGLHGKDSVFHWLRDAQRCSAVLTGVQLDFTVTDEFASKVVLVCAIEKAYFMIPGSETHSHDPAGDSICLWYNQFRSVNARICVTPPEFSNEEFSMFVEDKFLSIAGVVGNRIHVRSPTSTSTVRSATFRLPLRVEIWVVFSPSCDADQQWSASAGAMVLGISPKPVQITFPSINTARYPIFDPHTAGLAAMMTVLADFGSRLATHASNRTVLLIAPNRRISDAMVGGSKRSPRINVSEVETTATRSLSRFRDNYKNLKIDLRVRSTADTRNQWFQSALKVLKKAQDGDVLRPNFHPADLLWDQANLARIHEATR